MKIKYLLLQIILVVNLFGQDNELVDESLLLLNKYFTKAKEYSNQGKNILIEQTLLNGINGLVDTDKIKVKLFDIDDKTDAIKVVLFLKGEDKELQIDIKKFDWGVTEDKKYIVFENLDILLNIPWMQYIVKDMAKRDNGYIKVPHTVALFSLLYSIKPNIDSTYVYRKKKDFDLIKYPYDKNFVQIEHFKS